MLTSIARFLPLCIAFLLSFPLLTGQLHAQNSPLAPTVAAETSSKIRSLTEVVKTLEEISRRIESNSRLLSSKSYLGQEDAVRKDIADLQLQRDSLSSSLEEIITGVDTGDLNDEINDSEIDVVKEITSLLGPLIFELKKVTSRPREIEKLKRDAFNLERKLVIIEEAIANVKEGLAVASEKKLRDTITKIKDNWESKKQALRAQLDVVEHKLLQREENQESFSTSITQIFQLFFRSRGRNILVAVLASLGFWLFSNRFYAWLYTRPLLRKHNQKFEFRLLGITVHLLSIVGSVFIFLLVLYFFGDWVLLLLFSTLLVVTLWSSRTAITAFWSQITLLLNIGAVREGEVITLNNIPWKIDRLNLYCRLSNPRLSGGKIRITAGELLKMRSRPLVKGDVWFPTETGDWIVLGPDKQSGQIEMQTPEMVVLRLLGGSKKYFQTSTFVSLCPHVLTQGFRVAVFFGLDYRHQKELSESIISTLKLALTQELSNRGFHQNVRGISVEVKEAASSSITMALLADFDGAAAPQFERLHRIINDIAIRTCTTNGWTIPFNQIVLHKSENLDLM
jgi:hypothetical protein